MKPQLLVSPLVIPQIAATSIAPQVDQDDPSTNIFDRTISASAAFFVSYLSLINLHHLHIPNIHPAYRHFESNVVDRASPNSIVFFSYLPIWASPIWTSLIGLHPYDLAFGQLSYDGVPVFYAGENFKLLNARETPPVNSVTTTFSVSEGILQFSNPILPVDQASFCQDQTAQIYITFASRPPNCDPVSLVAYTGEINQNLKVLDDDHKAVSLSHYIGFEHDSEPTLECFIIIAISEYFVILFILAIIILNIALALSIFAVVDAGLPYSSVNGIHLGGSRKPYIYCNINAGFSD
ncbi:hypothetical protein CKAH01_15830 [Colletotrichum kahawae]|uniref:DUF7908 domain-containing protein n=1 Tax=Colletotrichum kahawae TaxID=34407 RepID=A0AAD9YF07_COLKA|nr:hypothetical protein CKAH01_15830 [Colletotrichum kahawae]